MGTEITTPLPPSHIESAALPNRAPPPCEQCHVRFSKYRCPRCSVRTCSLACSKSHKAATGCSGERSKNHFVPISKYGHQDMMSDYVFLEDLSRTTDTLTRENLRADPHRNMTKRAQFKGRQLVKQAERMGIQLTVMSPAMKRHQISQTNWSFRHKRIYWTIEWVFPESNKKNIYDHRIPSSQPLRQSLSTRLATSLDLNPYHAHGATGCFVMLKREHMPANHPPTFVDLTPYLDRALVEALRGEAVIEFPTLYVWTARPTEGVVVEEKVEIAAVKAEEKGRQEAGVEGKEEEGEAEGEEEEMEEEAEQVEQGEGEGDGNVVVVDLDLEKMLDALNNDLGGVRESEAEQL